MEEKLKQLIIGFRSKVADYVTNDDEPITTELITKIDDDFERDILALIQTAIQEARIDEHELVYNESIELEFNSFATWSDNRIKQLKSSLKGGKAE